MGSIHIYPNGMVPERNTLRSVDKVSAKHKSILMGLKSIPILQEIPGRRQAEGIVLIVGDCRGTTPKATM